jgi:predicted DNA-binding protein (UPF0251 family)
MGRPPIRRVVQGLPDAVYYKPAGVPLRLLEEVVLGLDELEALRLADAAGLDQEEVGRRMGVSRQTAGRILETARRKVAEALTQGKAIRIEGGPVHPPCAAPPCGPGPMGPGGGCGRGRGRGRRMGGPPAAGPGGACVCPKCGAPMARQA